MCNVHIDSLSHKDTATIPAPRFEQTFKINLLQVIETSIQKQPLYS